MQEYLENYEVIFVFFLSYYPNNVIEFLFFEIEKNCGRYGKINISFGRVFEEGQRRESNKFGY